jgi:L-gulono-1,4-lactone dehydrogenase
LKNYTFTNWGRNISVEIPHYYQPVSESEICDVVKKHRKIRLVGAGHSWSELCVSEEALINLDKYNQVLYINKDKQIVRIQAGIRLYQLNNELDKADMAIINLGSYDQQSVAGALSTCTHGTGIEYQILASQVESYSLIKADGTVEEITKTHPLFYAAVTGMGTLGIISEITLKVTPAFNIEDETIAVPFEEAVSNLKAWLKEYDHFKMWWIPHTGKMIVFKHHRTSQPEKYSRLGNWLKLIFLAEYMYRILLFIGHLWHQLRPLYNKLMINSYSRAFRRIQKSHEVFLVPEPPIHRETEWAFDIDKAEDLLREYHELIENSGHKINFIQEIRFTKGDNFMLSPCYRQDSVWIGAYLIGNKGWDALFADFEKFARKHDGRPHWGKEFTPDKSYLQSHYPLYPDFSTLRKQLDPHGKFENELIEKLF